MSSPATQVLTPQPLEDIGGRGGIIVMENCVYISICAFYHEVRTIPIFDLRLDN